MASFYGDTLLSTKTILVNLKDFLFKEGDENLIAFQWWHIKKNRGRGRN